MTALESALEAEFLPGTNLKGAVGGANWCFLLPRLELGQVLCLGRPSPSTLVTLSEHADHVAVWAKVEEHGLIAKQGLRNVDALVAERSGSLLAADRTVDALLVAEPGLVRSRLGAKTPAEIQRVLKPGGFLYREWRPALARRSRRKREEESLDRFGATDLLWLAPAFDEVLFVAPADDSRAIAYLERRFLKPIFRRELFKRPRRVLAQSRSASRWRRRRGSLVCVGGAPLAGPPGYVQRIAADAGVAVEAKRSALAAPGAYSSQKVLLFLFDGERAQPEAVVKITRDARHNSRLENEWRALTLLQERGIGQDGTCPSPLFLGYEAGFAVLGETALGGVPLLRQTSAAGELQHARSAVDWLVALAAATAHRPENESIAAARLQALLDRFGDLYSPPGDAARFLAGQVAAVAAAGDDVRLVFQHGDPGPWNLLVTPEGGPAFLDWEAGNPEGMPLWDIFHFLRSFGFSLVEGRRRQDARRSFADQLLSPSELNDLLVETVARSCAETSLPTTLVEPLFYLCWVHRAVKEASRLPPDQLHSGRYVNLLTLALEERDAPGLRRLFSLPA